MTRARIHPALRLTAVLAIAAAALTAAATAAAAPAPTSGVDLVFVTGAVGFPIDVDAPIGDERVFIADKAGTVEIWQDGALLPDPYLDIRDVVLDSGERGLLGIAFAPDYADSGKFYVDYIETGSSGSVIVEYEVSGGDPNAIDEGTRRELLRVGQPNSNHNGGALAIGPDGYLYIALGDGGSQNDPSGNGQNTSTLLSTIVRIDPVTAAAPGSNPFVGAPGADEIWAYGFRNPWRISFDAATGDLYIGDVGQGDREEVDYIPAGVGGGNYGWRIEEGSFCHRDEGVGCGSPALIRPVFEYDNTGGGGGSGAAFDGCSVTGGYVYRGNALPQLRGHYFYADACQSWVRSFRVVSGQAVNHTDWTGALNPPGGIISFGTDGFGELYLMTSSSVYKFVPENPAPCDVDGDGYSDLPVSAPGENRSGNKDTGVAHVMYGSALGVGGPGDFFAGVLEPKAQFGSAIACADFDGDGFDDVAFGAPGADVSGQDKAGTVLVTYGSNGGVGGTEEWNKDTGGIAGVAAAGDRWGAALAAGDFNRDGYDDLAIGVPRRDTGGQANSGAVHVIYGSAGGLTNAGDKGWSQDSAGIANKAEKGDKFGEALTAGDIDGDGFADLVVGVPGEGIGGVKRTGAVQVLFGSSGGVSKRDKLVHRDSPGILGTLKKDARFGSAVVTGSFDADGFDDLAIGVPGHKGGQLTIISGGIAGLTKDDLRLQHGLDGIPGNSIKGDAWGSALAAGDFDGDGFDDLAAGAPGDNLSGFTNAGTFTEINGSVDGLDPSTSDRWRQDSKNMAGAPASDDAFGAALRSGDFDGDGYLDVGIGVPQTAAGGAGEVNVMFGRVTGLKGKGSQLIDQDDAGGDNSEAGDWFGTAL